MYTDFYFTNKSSLLYKYSIALFQKSNTLQNIDKKPFVVIENCPYGWSNKVRIYWNLSFRLVDQFDNLSPIFHLADVCTKPIKKHLLFKEGTITIKQYIHHGNMVVDFDQTKGNKIQGIHFYRGKLLIHKQSFNNKTLYFETSTNICFEQCAKSDTQSIVDFDFTGLKKLYITSKGDQNTGNKFQLIRKEKW
jgi:hypothetical protein